jgi:hypothetical protein
MEMFYLLQEGIQIQEKGAVYMNKANQCVITMGFMFFFEVTSLCIWLSRIRDVQCIESLDQELLGFSPCVVFFGGGAASNHLIKTGKPFL